ncbi:hypothetical protein FRB99_005439 [Tulasnella sp. 403]|nr:hypothetical protein FRB99_005439 [Tulasnella sp. 403]
MTFSYLLAIPLLLVRSISMMVIKYEMGYTFIPGFGIIPKPYILWPDYYQRWIFPAQLCFALAWGLEVVSHLEELCFWLFLTRMTPLHMSWFGSINFWVWIIGSIVGVAGMPLVAIFTRSDPLKCEAWIVLVGSIGSTIITVVFFRVLYIFPGFLRRVKTEGAGQDVVTRLVTFHQINVVRVGFRLLFVLPMLCLGIDGIMSHHHVNESAKAQEEKSFFNSPAVEAQNPFASMPEPALHRAPVIEYKNSIWEIEQASSNDPIRLPLSFKYPPASPQYQNRRSIHPLVLNYRSPIDVMEADQDRLMAPRYI